MYLHICEFGAGQVYGFAWVTALPREGVPRASMPTMQSFSYFRFCIVARLLVSARTVVFPRECETIHKHHIDVKPSRTNGVTQRMHSHSVTQRA